jgi:hypothetical protein
LLKKPSDTSSAVILVTGGRRSEGKIGANLGSHGDWARSVETAPDFFNRLGRYGNQVMIIEGERLTNPLRGLPKVNGEALLIAAGQNLKRLLSRAGWGRRPWPSGAAGVVLPAAQALTVSPW